jgi:hypothetical protein
MWTEKSGIICPISFGRREIKDLEVVHNPLDDVRLPIVPESRRKKKANCGGRTKYCVRKIQSTKYRSRRSIIDIEIGTILVPVRSTVPNDFSNQAY